MYFKSINNNNLAFIILNRYLDLYESIEEKTLPEKSENFEITDFKDFNNLSEKNQIDENQKNEIRDFLL